MYTLADALVLVQWEEQNLTQNKQKLANFVQYFQGGLETNPEGQPLNLIDPTVIAECLPYAETTDDVPEEKLFNAMHTIDFVDNMPCVDGTPIWERLDGEQIEYYKLFKEYRDMKYAGDTHLNTRSIARLSEQLNVPGRLINIVAKIYHWIIRVKAYDKQKAYEIALARHRNIEQLEFKHADFSNKILEQAMEFLTKNPAKLDPKVALQMMELGMKYGRISAGLLGDKPGTHSQAAAANAAGLTTPQMNIAISQHNTHNEAGQMLNVTQHGNGNGANGRRAVSEADKQLQQDMKDPAQLLSVLHVLNESGAFKAAASPADASQRLDDDVVFDPYDDGTALDEIIEVEVEDEVDEAAALIIKENAVPEVGGYNV